jgi:protein arginine kinase activator
MKCDRCDNPATVHLIEIVNGKKIEKHLCEQHAVEEGVQVKVTNAPINELLEKFVLKHSGGGEPAVRPSSCENCGMTYAEFRKRGLLGCPQCYDVFKPQLEILLKRAHEGANEHVGKIPARAGADELRQQRLMQLRRELEQAVAAEQYEKAAKLRDEVRQVETGEGGEAEG